MFTSEYDVFFGAQDQQIRYFVPFSQSLSGTYTPNAEGDWASVASVSSATVGDIVTVSDADHSVTAEIRFIDSTNNKLFLVPLQDRNNKLNTTPFDTSPATTIKNVDTYQDIFSLPIDLSEAPDEWYQYVVLAYMDVGINTSASVANIRIARCENGSLPLESYCFARYTVGSSSAYYDDKYAYNAAFIVWLRGGSTNIFTIQGTGSSTTAKCKFRSPRITAIRSQEVISKGYPILDSTNATSWDTSNSTTSNTTVTTSITVNQSGDYLIIGSRTLSAPSGVDAISEITIDGVAIDDVTHAGRGDSTDRHTQGFIGYATLDGIGSGSGNAINMWVRSGTSSSTVYARCPFLAAIRVPNRTEEIYAPFSALLGSASTGDVSVTSGSVFTSHPSISIEMIGNGFNEAKGLEFYSSDIRKAGNGHWEAAPVYSTSTLSYNSPAPYVFNNNNATGARGVVGAKTRQRVFWFQRLTWNGYSTGTIKLRSFPTPDSSSAIFRNTYAVAVAEKLPIPAREGIQADIVGEFEYGAVVSNWTSASTYYSSSTVYKKDLTGLFSDVSRVVLNGADLLPKTDAYLTQRAKGSWAFNNDDPSVEVVKTNLTSNYTVGNSTMTVSPTTMIKAGQKILVVDSSNSKKFFHAIVLSKISGTLEVKTLNYKEDVKTGYVIDVSTSTWTVTSVEGNYLYVNLPDNTNPFASSSGNRIVVIGKKRFSREITELYDENMTAIMVDTRMTKLPTISQNLEIRGSQIKSTQSFNSIELSNGDGLYDNLPGRYVMDGMSIKIYKSWRNTTDSRLSGELVSDFRKRKIGYRSLNYYEKIVDGVQSAPDFSKEKYKINILPKVINSIKPICEYRGIIFSGNDLSNIERSASFPIIYGYARRVEAKRITPITYDETTEAGNSNQIHLYRIACHEIHSIWGVYAGANSTYNIQFDYPSITSGTYGPIETTYNGSTAECKELLKRGIIAIKNNNIFSLAGDSGAIAGPDSVFVDCFGRTHNGEIAADGGAAVIWPGEIIQHFMRAFPASSDMSIAASTTLASAAISVKSDGTTSISILENNLLKLTVSSRTGFLPGDRIKISDSTTASKLSDNSYPYFWAVVTSAYTLSGAHVIEAWPVLEPGDLIDGVRTYPFTTSPASSASNVKVERYVPSSLYAITTTTTANINNKEPDPEIEFTISVSSTLGFFAGAEIEVQDTSGNKFAAIVSSVKDSTSMLVRVVPRPGYLLDDKYDYASGSTVRILPIGPYSVSENDLDTGSLRDMDHTWRKRLVHNFGAMPADPVVANFVMKDTKITIANFLDKAAKSFFSYSYINRGGRLSFRPVGFEDFNLIPNAGFEQDPMSLASASLSYPIFSVDDGVGGEFDGGTFGTAVASAQLIVANSTSSLPAYEGQRCMKVTGGSYLGATTPTSNAYKSVVLKKSGWYYLSCKTLGVPGNDSQKHLRFAVSLPGDGYKQIETAPSLDISDSIIAATMWLQFDKEKTDFADTAKAKANVWLQSDKVDHLYSNNGSVYSLLDYSSNQYTVNNYSKWPGGFSSNFTQWHRSQDLTTYAGTSGAIARWDDIGVGSSPNWVMTTTSLKPIVTQNFINGQPAAYFLSKVLIYGSNVSLGTSHNLFIVFRTDYVDNNFTLFSDSSGGWKLSWVKATGVLRYTLNSVSYDFSWTPTTKTFYVLAINRVGATLKAYVNGVQIGTTQTISAPSVQFYVNYLGSDTVDATGSNTLKGYVSEVVLESSGSYECLAQGIAALGAKFAIDTNPSPRLVTSARNGCSSVRFDATAGAESYYDQLAIDNNDTDIGVDLGTIHTISFAIKPVVVNSFNYLIGNYDSVSLANGSAVYYRTNKIVYRAGNSSPVEVTYTLNANTWYIITVQRDGSLVSFYVNGTQVGATQDLTTQSAEKMYIKYIGAQSSSGTNAINAELGEVFATRYLLSQEERQAIEYYLSQKWNIVGVSDVASQKIFEVNDYSGNNYDMMVDSGWVYSSTLATSWWKPESLSTLANDDSVSSWSDSKPNARTLSQATSGSMPKYLSGACGGPNGYGCVTFDGTNDTLALSSSYSLGSYHTITIVFRINTSDLGANYASGTVQNLLYESGGSSIDLFSGTIFYRTDTGGAYGSTTWSPETNKWYVLSFVRTNSTPSQVAVYLNGAPLSTITLAGGTTTTQFKMNTIGKNGGYSTYFKGQIAEIITSLNYGSFAYDSHSYLCKKYNITTFAPIPVLIYNNRNSLSTLTFDDTATSLAYYDYLSISSSESSSSNALNIGDDHTVMVMFKITTIETTTYLITDYNRLCGITIETSGTVIRYNVDTDYVNVSYTFVAGRWYLLTCTRSGAAVKFYVNGKLIGTGSLTTRTAYDFTIKTLGSRYPTGGISGSTSSGYSMTGDFGEVYVANRVLTDSQRETLENSIMYKWGLAYTPNEVTGKWVKNELVFYLAPGEAGNAIVRIYPQYNSYTSQSHYIDNFELYHISGLATDATSNINSVDNEDENYYEIEVPYLVNNSNDSQKYTMTVRDFDAYGLSGFLYSEAKGALPSSGILKIDGIDYTDADSARGMGAAYARYFGRMRQSVKMTILDAVRIPCVGDKICVKLSRAPISADNDNIWTIVNVQVSGDMARQVEITAIRQVDPWIDRNKRTTY